MTFFYTFAPVCMCSMPPSYMSLSTIPTFSPMLESLLKGFPSYIKEGVPHFPSSGSQFLVYYCIRKVSGI